MLRRKSSLSKRPSVVKVKSNNLTQENGLRVSHEEAPSLPKTRFSLTEKSCPSPRLKSFPAEQLRRSDPQQSPRETADASHGLENSGQGDTPVHQCGPHPHALPQSFALQPHTMSEQQVPQTVCPVYDAINHSDLVIPSPPESASKERPPHRPHVPPADVTLRAQSPRKPAGPQPADPPQSVLQARLPGPNDNEPNHHHPAPWRIESESMGPLNPAEGSGHVRYTKFYPVDDPIPQYASSAPDPSNSRPVVEEKSSGWPQAQQTYQRHQPSAPYPCSNVQLEGGQFTVADPGMTSPQDLAMSRKQNWHSASQPCSCPHGPWTRSNGPQPASVATPQVQPGAHEHQAPLRNWQTQEQNHRQQDQGRGQTGANTASKVKMTPGNARQPKKQDDNRKPLSFNPSMIRDQEMLLATLRQQGIPEDIMRRQFDTLLAEQRKQLLYLEQLQRGQSNASKTPPQERRVHRKISKIEEDGKPEWMLHITPPRIPYSVIENMRNEREVGSERHQKAGHTEAPADAPQYYQTAQENCHQVSQNGPNTWQYSAPMAQDCSNANAPNHHQTCTMTGPQGAQPQVSCYGHPTQQHCLPQERWQDATDNPREDVQRVQGHQQPEKMAGPSSLLKLRMYKEVIRRQKQNNGLQDPETVKEAMEALRNPANRKGLEYLDDLNKKSGKPVSLNGAQDTSESDFPANGATPPGWRVCQPPRMPSANGLQSQKNRNQPAPSAILRHSKVEDRQWSEYPRQRNKSAPRDCYSLVAERESGTVDTFGPKGGHNAYPTMPQNSIMRSPVTTCSSHEPPRPESGAQLPGQFNPPSPSTPLTFAQQNHHHCQTAQAQASCQYPGNCGQTNGFPMGGNIGRGNANAQPGCAGRNNEMQEVIVSGGLKYLARKPEYVQHSPYPHFHHGANSDKYLNTSVPCQ